MITAGNLQHISGARSRSRTIQQIADAFNKYAGQYGVTSQKDVAQFLANVSIETGGFRHLAENMNYSAKRLRQVWPSRFKTVAKAKQYENNPQKLANYVYGDRLGNKGRENAGWLYRGSGPGQVTGYSNFLSVQKETGLPVVSNPDLLREADSGMRAALILWQKWGLSAMDGQTTNIRKRWNGGSHGLNEVKAAYARAMQIDLSMPVRTPAKPVETRPARQVPTKGKVTVVALLAVAGATITAKWSGFSAWLCDVLPFCQ